MVYSGVTTEQRWWGTHVYNGNIQNMKAAFNNTSTQRSLSII